jgi:tight adherence protein C
VRSRLDRLGSDSSVERFRIEQLLWGLGGLLASSLLLGTRYLGGSSADPIVAVVLTLLAFIAGVLMRDRMLSIEVKRRITEMEAEFPTLVELLALAVGAGEGVVSALERVSRVGQGPLVSELERALAQLRAGSNLNDALTQLARRVDVPEVRRFVDALVVALERGTPMADVLAAQAADARERQRRSLIESGGRKEIAMMIPVVFLVLPLSVFYALFPGFYGLSLGTS